MTEFLDRIFGCNVQQTILDYFNTMKAKGGEFVQEMKFTGKLRDPGKAVFGFAKSEVNVALKAKYELGDNKQVYLTDVTVTPEVPWFKKYFFFCKQGNRFNFPSFPSVDELKKTWCKFKIDTKAEHPEGKEWCATDAKIWDEYFLYGDPYPASLQECAVVRSLEVYNFHFEPDSDGIDVESDIKYDLRFRFLGYRHIDNSGKMKRGYDISKYFVGGLMLGGAYDEFKRLLAKTKANMDCTPALEGLLRSMMGPRLAATR